MSIDKMMEEIKQSFGDVYDSLKDYVPKASPINDLNPERSVATKVDRSAKADQQK